MQVIILYKQLKQNKNVSTLKTQIVAKNAKHQVIGTNFRNFRNDQEAMTLSYLKNLKLDLKKRKPC